MATYQAIIAEIDRRFLTSLGNWTGDAVWLDFAPGFQVGVAELSLPPGEAEKTMVLSYPNIKVKPGKTYRADLHLYANATNAIITFRWELADGIYTLTEEQAMPSEIGGYSPDFNKDVPPDFNQTLATLSISALEGDHQTTDLLWVGFCSLIYETISRVQYLPIMGIG